MASTWLQALVGGLAGGLGGYAQGKSEEAARKEREAERKRQQDQFDAQMAESRRGRTLQENQFDYSRLQNTLQNITPDTDLSGTPDILALAAKFGTPLNKRTIETPAAPVAQATMPNVPTFGLRQMLLGVTPPDAAPPVLDTKPMDMPGQTMGLGGVKDVVTRPETRQEAQASALRANDIAMFESFLKDPKVQANPTALRMIQSQVSKLKAGLPGTFTESELLSVMRGTEPPAPKAGPTPDANFVIDFKIANKKEYDPLAATDAELAATREYQNKHKLGGTRPPQSATPPPPLSDTYLKAIADNPALMVNMTATERTKVQKALIESGISNLGREMQPQMLNRVTEEQSAVASLTELKRVMQNAESKLGPVAGWSKLNPMDPKARTVLAEIDLVRQRVGKALEGGVLRKEDEEKYKRILAVMTDLPEAAYNKIDSLVNTLERDQKVFLDALRVAGWRVPNFGSTSAPPEGAIVYERGPDGKLRPKGGG